MVFVLPSDPAAVRNCYVSSRRVRTVAPALARRIRLGDSGLHRLGRDSSVRDASNQARERSVLARGEELVVLRASHL